MVATANYGLCECGCGKPTPIARQTKSYRGQYVGQPLRFIHGHNIISRDRAFRKLDLEPSMWLQDSHGCWLWRGRVSPAGYGMLGGRLAHRVSYEKAKGAIPKSFDLDHLCRVRQCINPGHLEAVPRAINIRRGAKTKLTPEFVAEIRRLYRGRAFTQPELAQLYGTTNSHISHICGFKTWKPVEQYPAEI